MAKFDPASYRIYLRNSIISGKNKHILVEGKDDKYLIERLYLDFLVDDSKYTHNKILVDSAENIIKGDESISLSKNRDKVEYIANSIIGKPYADGFVGFVDRELHKFEWNYECNAELQDLLNSHDVIQRLVLSRGHSIENYIFDVSIFCEVLQILSTTVSSGKAIELFKETFQSTLRIACSIGLASTKSQVLSRTYDTIDYNLFERTSLTEVSFKFDDWVEKLVVRGISTDQERQLRLHYLAYKDQVTRASISLVRWICHGHIGFDFLKALYERCITEVCPITQDKSKELSGISWISKEKLFYTFVNYWVKQSLQEQYNYPIVIFELLGII